MGGTSEAAATAAAATVKAVDPPPGEPPPPRARRRQWTAALLANLVAVCSGTAVSWTSPTQHVLQGEEDIGSWAGSWTHAVVPSEPLSSSEVAVVAALVPIGALLGAVPAGMLARRIGCRRPLLALGPIFTVGWALIFLAGPWGIWPMLIGRALHGIGTGASTVLVPLYSDEVAEVAIRGTLGALLDLSMCNGVLLAYTLALGTPYALLTLVCACVPVIFTITFFFMPESPVFLSRAGRREEALQALAWLRPGWSPLALNNELATLTAEEPKDPSDQKLQSEHESKTLKKRKLCCVSYTSSSAKAVFISYTLMFFQQASGISAVISYSTNIFEEEGGSMSPRTATVLLGALQSTGGVVAALAVERAGRRPLLVSSAAVVSAMLVALAAVESEVAPWLPPVALGAYIFAIEVGLGPLPWFITAELCGPTASGGAVALNWASAATVTLLYPGATEMFGQRPLFAAFAVLAALAVLFTLFLLPETRGKTRAQLREEMKSWPRKPPLPESPRGFADVESDTSKL